MAAKYKLVFMRHGESEYNVNNRFCGWHDPDLTKTGVKEAVDAGKLLKERGYEFDLAFTSVLKRAIKTLYLIQEELDCHWLPVIRSWRLNERHYGGLQGLDKSATAAKYGEEQVQIWRRSYDIRPPPEDESVTPQVGQNPQYAKTLSKELIPTCESLKDSVERALPFWYEHIVPAIRADQRILILSHGNIISALHQYLNKAVGKDSNHLDLLTATPLVYELDEHLHPVRHYYLVSEDTKGTVQAKLDAQENFQPLLI